MRTLLRRSIGIGLIVVTVLSVGLFLVTEKEQRTGPVIYGMSFNTMYAEELELDWRTTYDAFLDELGVRHLRLAAHWPMVEPRSGQYNFIELDYQVARAEAVGAEIVMSVGRRLPRWPECHIPEWVPALNEDAQQEALTSYIEAVVERYKDSPAITHWQVENEPYLGVFAYEHCGDLDEELLREEVELVRTLDPSRQIILTDSGNLGTWYGAYSQSDVFGTSMYIYLWNPELGQLRTVLPPWWYRFKEGAIELFARERETWLIELSAEPWLLEPIAETDLATQFERMDIEKFNEIIEYAEQTQYTRQYLWGGEWWYWLLQHNEPAMWERGRELFEQTPAPTRP